MHLVGLRPVELDSRLRTFGTATDKRGSFYGTSPVHPFDDLRRRTVVRGQLDGLGVWPAPVEPGQQRRIATFEREDRLVRIADRGERLTVTEPRLEQRLLRRVDVLILVDEEHLPPTPHLLGDLR